MQVVGQSDPTPTQQSREAIEALVPGIYERDLEFSWVLPNGQATVKAYKQAMLGMFPVQEFSTLITEILESFTQGEMGIKLGELFRGNVEMPAQLNEESVNNLFEENKAYIAAFIKLVQILPGLQLDIIVLSLGVPRLEREWAKGQLQEPPHRGGLTVEEGFDILIHFIQQNSKLVREVVLGKAKELFEVVQVEILGQEPATEEEPENPLTAIKTDTSTPGGTPSSISSPDTQVSA